MIADLLRNITVGSQLFDHHLVFRNSDNERSLERKKTDRHSVCSMEPELYNQLRGLQKSARELRQGRHCQSILFFHFSNKIVQDFYPPFSPLSKVFDYQTCLRRSFSNSIGLLNSGNSTFTKDMVSGQGTGNRAFFDFFLNKIIEPH